MGDVRFVDKFFQMEQSNDLFAMRDENDFPVWDILRFDIYLSYVFDNVSNNGKQSVLKKMSIALVGVFRLLASAFHLFFVKKDVLIFENLRYKKGSLYFDAAVQDFLDVEKDNFVAVSKYKALHRFDHFVEYDFVNLYVKLFNKHARLPNNVVQKIQNALSSINLEPVSSDYLNELYNMFLSEFSYYMWFLRVKHPKRIICSRDSNKKGLIYAAAKLDISFYEVQHGMFSKNHLLYSYPDCIECNSHDIIVPPKLFTFDALWGVDINVPFIRIPVGNSFFSLDTSLAEAVKCSSVRNSILVISSKVHADYLIRLIREYLNKTKSSVDIIYKLHPNEYSCREFYENIFSTYANVKIIADECATSALFVNSKLVVLINSTVFYEAMSYGIPIAVYKKMNYDSYLSFIDNSEVYAFDGVDDFIPIVNNDVGIQPKSFFKSFDKNIYLKEVDN